MGPKDQEGPPSAASFGELVEWLSMRGVRPRDSLHQRKAWGKKELAGIVGRSPKQISNWIKNKSLPRQEELPLVERAFFGTDQNYQPELRMALREALQRSRAGRQVAEAENFADIGSNPSSAELAIDRDAVLLEILKNVTGLPLAVARSIVDDFGIEGKEKSLGEIEAILRRKAQEYQALKAQVSQLAVSDPNVKALRDEALQHIDRGQFDLAYKSLVAARDIDRSSSQAAQSVVQSRRRSEAETMLTTARLAGIRNRYREAVANLIEARTLIHGLEPGIEHEAISLAAEYLNSEYREGGDARMARRNIEFFNQVLLPASEGFPESVLTQIKYQLADVYSTFGYRMSDNKIQRDAIKQYRLIQPSINASNDADLRLRCHIGLGQLVAELGLNRGSVRQARLGVSLMKNGLDVERDSPSAASRAAALINLGTAQANTALVSKENADYEDAVESYNAARGFLLFRSTSGRQRRKPLSLLRQRRRDRQSPARVPRVWLAGPQPVNPVHHGAQKNAPAAARSNAGPSRFSNRS